MFHPQKVPHALFIHRVMAYSDRTYVGSGPGPEWVTILCQTFTLQLMWELKQVLYFGIVLVLVPVPHKFCLNKPLGGIVSNLA